MRTAVSALAFLALGAFALGADVTFTAKPTATKAGDQVKIAFTVSAPTDVEVAILGADGKVVRHLAAGVLGGKNPPPAPLKEGLAQELTWDGKDDLGNVVFPAPAAKTGTGTDFGKSAEIGASPRFRVRAGTSVKFGRMIGGSPATGTLSADSLALDADGTIYIKMASVVPQLHQVMPWHLRKFDRTGKYIKTLLPYAPSTDPSKTAGFRLIDAGDGLLTPGNTNPLDPALYHFGDTIHHRVVDGSVVFIDNNTARMTFFKVDGSNAVTIVPMRTKPDKLKWPKWLAPQVAFSADGHYAYYSNVANTPYDANVHPSKMDQKFPQGRVYRQDLGKPGADPEKFYDLVLPDYDQKKYWLPNAWNKRSAAGGIDVDAKGNLFVCDLVNQEVAQVGPDGKKVDAVPVPWPDKVLASSKTGALYVVSRAISEGYPPPATLIKITGRGADAKQVAKLPLRGDLGFSLALDESSDPPALWVAGTSTVLRVEDKGSELVPADQGIINTDKNAIGFIAFGDVDREHDLVYVTSGMGPVWRYNGETGEGGPAPIKACDLAIGRDGRIYTWGNTGSYAGPVARYFRDFKPAPLANGKNTYGYVYGRYGRGNNAPGMAVDNRGWVYAICGFNNCVMYAWDAEGKPVDIGRKVMAGEDNKKQEVPVIIDYVLDQGGSVRIDPEYNIYVLELGLPKGFVVPKGFEKDPMFRSCTGTIWKFTPKGGTFKKVAGAWQGEGAIATYAASGPISGSWASTMSVCHCNRPRFDVDPYGRLYIPNGITYKVSVRDNADNEFLNFGGYGNFDAQGPKSAEPKPEIPIGGAIFAFASDKHIYVGDALNHRVVRVDKAFAAEESCEVK